MARTSIPEITDVDTAIAALRAWIADVDASGCVTPPPRIEINAAEVAFQTAAANASTTNDRVEVALRLSWVVEEMRAARLARGKGVRETEWEGCAAERDLLVISESARRCGLRSVSHHAAVLAAKYCRRHQSICAEG